jgi:hypothetical protein
MATITIQFDGICCHINPPNGSPINVQRRSVLPGVHDHITYIEMYANDVDPNANPQFSFDGPYTRFNNSYLRTRVNNVRIELLNISSTTFMELPSFAQRIPKLGKVAEPDFTNVKAHLVQTTIPSGRVAAYFDINFGFLSSGPSEDFRTVFEPPRNWPVRHLGQWAQLEIEVTGDIPTLHVTDLAQNTSSDLVLKPGADLITIGNQMLNDILGQPVGDGHFVHYYELADPEPATKPIPRKAFGLGVGCSDTQWP